MTPEEMRAHLEEELLWRQEEMSFFKNQLAVIEKDDDKVKYRKSLIPMLYGNFEGFVKVSLLTYIQYLNELHIKCSCVNKNIAASTLSREFYKYDDLDRKCQIFRTQLPEDTQLHRYYRRVDFLENIDGFLSKDVAIADKTINTESNLWSIVLKKNLFKVGLPVDLFAIYDKDIDDFVNRRNGIAHGNSRSGVSEKEYSRWETKIYHIMSVINITLYDYAVNRKYLL